MDLLFRRNRLEDEDVDHQISPLITDTIMEKERK